ALERSAIERLFERVRQVIGRGVAVLYISHHLEEVFDICHDVAVLRDGAVVAEAPTGEFSEQSLVEAMVGAGAAHAAGGRSRPRAGPGATAPRTGATGDTPARLEMHNVSASSPAGSVEEVTLEIAPGDRLGVTGLQGSGATTLGRLVAGAVKPTSGRIRVDGDVLAAGRPDLALRAGVGYVPEDRHAEGYVSDLGVAENMTMTVVDTLARHGLLRRRAQADAARPLVAMLDVVTSSANQPVGELSGGNQQKAVVGRALARSPRLVVALTPTRGVDVASKAVLLEALVTQTEERRASLLLATDEIDDLAVCDRVIVMVGGRVFKEFTDPPWDREALIAASEGLDAPVPAGQQPAGQQPAGQQPAGQQPAGQQGEP
ncbi:MAG: ATP-binding cassette domain-containing protein, partial [Acidimicrobiales bacterium]